mgnify:CR=1 FL=1
MAKPRVKLKMNKLKIDERALKKVAEQKVAEMADDLTVALNDLTPYYEGRPIEEVKSAVQETWAEASGGGSITDPHLTAFAEQISQGGRVVVRLGETG